MLESELVRLREENADLKKQVGEISGIEDKRKKAEQKAEQLETKASRDLGGRRAAQLTIRDGQMEELTRDRVTQKENELNAQYDERMRNYEERYESG